MPFNLGNLVKSLGPETANVLSEFTPEMASVAGDLIKGGGGTSFSDKSAAVSTAVQNMLTGGGTSESPPSGIDRLQNVLDIAGIVDPTPTIDAVNMAISLVRASKAATPEEKKRHVTNAVISGISMVPYIGDTAKISKLTGKIGKSGSQAGKATHVPTDTVRGGMSPPTQPPLPIQTPPAAAPLAPSQPRSAPPAGLASNPPRPSSPGPLVTPVSPPAPGTQPPPPSLNHPNSPPPTPPGQNPVSPAQSAPPTPPSGGAGSLIPPFLIGAGAGALAGFFGGGFMPTNPQHYSISRDVAGPSGRVGSEAMQILKNRGEEIFNPLIHPIEALLNPIGSLTKSFTGLVKAADEIPSAFMHWGQSLVDSQRHLQQWSGLLAGSIQESQVREMMRDFKSAGRTAGTTSELTRVLDDLKDDLQPFKDVVSNLTNTIATFAVKSIDYFVVFITELKIMGTSIRDIVDIGNFFMAKDDAGKTAAFDFMDNIRKLPDRLTKPPGEI